tara:strand:+ start:1560 stop:1718 length:159 start_codon:yes stop_codon:yes gene_type:complete
MNRNVFYIFCERLRGAAILQPMSLGIPPLTQSSESITPHKFKKLNPGKHYEN